MQTLQLARSFRAQMCVGDIALKGSLIVHGAYPPLKRWGNESRAPLARAWLSLTGNDTVMLTVLQREGIAEAAQHQFLLVRDVNEFEAEPEPGTMAEARAEPKDAVALQVEARARRFGFDKHLFRQGNADQCGGIVGDVAGEKDV